LSSFSIPVEGMIVFMAGLFMSFLLGCMYKEHLIMRDMWKHLDNDGSKHLSEESSRILAAKKT
jgi:hypothetical protein